MLINMCWCLLLRLEEFTASTRRPGEKHKLLVDAEEAEAPKPVDSRCFFSDLVCFVIWLLIFGLVLILCVTYRINVEEERLFNLNKRLFQPPPYESLNHGVSHTQ